MSLTAWSHTHDVPTQHPFTVWSHSSDALVCAYLSLSLRLSQTWLQCDILAEDIALLLLLEVPMLDSHELEGVLLTAWNWKDACLEVDHASWVLRHTSAVALLESVAAS